MPLKKPVASKKAATAEKPRPSAAKTWTLPVTMVMVTVAAMGLWIAMRESASRTQAATPAVTAPVAPVVMASAKPAAPAPAPAEKPAEPKSSDGKTVEAKLVSITGCLQRTDSGFVLKDTEGASAPKSRSWKSGFLKRSTSSIVLTNDASNPARFSDYVGRRVSVTGPLAEREMRVTSMRRLSPTCE